MASRRLSNGWADYAPPDAGGADESAEAAADTASVANGNNIEMTSVVPGESSEPADLTSGETSQDGAANDERRKVWNAQSTTFVKPIMFQVSHSSVFSPHHLSPTMLVDAAITKTCLHLQDLPDGSVSKRTSRSRRNSSAVSARLSRYKDFQPFSMDQLNFARPVYSSYKHPQVLRRWGVPAAHAHVNWDDLFFDLIYVGVAYKLGVMLNYSIEDGYAWTGALYLCAIFVNVFTSWRSMMEYNARFAANDAAHKAYNLLVITFGTACTCLHIPYGSVSEFWNSNYHYELGILIGLLFDRILSLLKWWEVRKYRKEIWKGWWSTASSSSKSPFQKKWDGEGLTPYLCKPDGPSTTWQKAVIIEKVVTDDAGQKLTHVESGTPVYAARIIDDLVQVNGLHHRSIYHAEKGVEIRSQTIRKTRVLQDQEEVPSEQRSSVFSYRGKKYIMDTTDDGWDDTRKTKMTPLEKDDVVMVCVRPSYELGENVVATIGFVYVVSGILYFIGAVFLLISIFVWTDPTGDDDGGHRRERSRHLGSSYYSYSSYSSSYGSSYSSYAGGDDFVHPSKLDNGWVHLIFILILVGAHLFDSFWFYYNLTKHYCFPVVASKPKRIPPLHLDYSIERYGEWVMYMLGASVLNLVLEESDDSSSSFYSVFFAGFLLAQFVLNSYYHDEVFESQTHAMSRNMISGWTWLLASKYYSMFLVTLGAGIKMMLKYSDDNYEVGEEPHRDHLVNVVCISALAVMVLQFLFKRAPGWHPPLSTECLASS